MKTLYLDCSMGAAGDMLSGALLELIPHREEFIRELNSIGLEGTHIAALPCVKCGIRGTRFSVTVNGEEEESIDVHEHHHEHEHEHHHEHGHEHHHEHGHEHHHEHEHEHHHEHGHEHHHHSSMKDIEAIINGLKVSDWVKKNALEVYSLIAEAESHAHGVPVTDIHFHEVGTADAVADIVTVCTLIEKIAPDRITASPVCVGSGQVRCAHGILPVPAPATAYILKGVPVYSGDIRAELCTPTGAALLKHFADSFGEMPLMTLEATGYGMGKKEFEAANCLRALLGSDNNATELMYEISCNVDDMTGEEISFAAGKLLEAAKDVYTVPVGMKKSRTGIMITALVTEENKDRAITLMLKHTSTIGVRERTVRRHVLEREIITVDTPYGAVRAKRSHGYGVERIKYEYDDIARLAEENNTAIEKIKEELWKR